MSNPYLVDLSSVDWKLLAQQKETVDRLTGAGDRLTSGEIDHLRGLFYLIDYLEASVAVRSESKLV